MRLNTSTYSEVAELEYLGSGGNARSAFSGGTYSQLTKVFYGYFLGPKHRLTAKRAVRFCPLQGGLLALGFLHLCCNAAEAAASWWKWWKRLPGALANPTVAPRRCSCGRRGNKSRNRRSARRKIVPRFRAAKPSSAPGKRRWRSSAATALPAPGIRVDDWAGSCAARSLRARR